MVASIADHTKLSLMTRARQSIIGGTFPAFVREFVATAYPAPGSVPQWAVDALAHVNISLEPVAAAAAAAVQPS